MIKMSLSAKFGRWTTVGHLSPPAGRGRIALAFRVRGSLRERGGNRFQNPRHMEQNVVIPESQQAIIMLDEPFIADHVVRAFRMLASVHLDNEVTFPANEVDDIATNRLLADEFVTAQAARPQSMPQRIFRICRGTAQASGALCLRLSCPARAARAPHPDCCAIRPLPARGERWSKRLARSRTDHPDSV